MQPEIIALTELCKQWGGDLRLLSPENFAKIFPPEGKIGWLTWETRGCYHAPFSDNVGVNWKRKIVYGPLRENEWPVLIHEMGHVFACRANPRRCKDDFEFLGWEIAVARFIRCNMDHWEHVNRDYQLGDDPRSDTIGRATRRVKKHLYEERLEASRKLGLLNARLEPLAIR